MVRLRWFARGGQAPAFLAVVRGPSHIFEFVNEAYTQLVGHRPLIGRELAEALPEIREQGFSKLLDHVLETGEPYVGRAVPVLLERTLGAAPEERVLDFVYFPLIEADGSRNGVIVHGVDVTDHVRARRESEEARAQAEAANRAKSEFLAIMSHELRTPLNAIDGYSELLELGIRGPINESQREDLQRIRKSQRHLLGLINDVLSYARVETSSMRYNIVEVAVDETLALCDVLTEPQRRAKGIAFQYDGCEPVVAVRADRDRVQQIVINLLTNAMKFTDRGGARPRGCGSRSRDQPRSGSWHGW